MPCTHPCIISIYLRRAQLILHRGSKSYFEENYKSIFLPRFQVGANHYPRGGGGGTLIFPQIHRLGSFFGFKIFRKINILGGFQKNEYFLGVRIFCGYFLGSSQILDHI